MGSLRKQPGHGRAIKSSPPLAAQDASPQPTSINRRSLSPRARCSRSRSDYRRRHTSRELRHWGSLKIPTFDPWEMRTYIANCHPFYSNTDPDPRICFRWFRIRIQGNFNSVNLVFPIKCFAMFFHINYIYYLIRNVTKHRLLGESVEKTNQSLPFFVYIVFFKDNFFSWFR